MHAMVLTAPGAPLRFELRADPVPGPGEVRVKAGIPMSDIPSIPYDILWGERQLLSVANLTRNDGTEFFKIAAQAGIRTHTTTFPLQEANEVLAKLRAGQITGAAVLAP